MRNLDGKVAVITGGASGIGLAMAHRFGAEGMRLVIADVQQDALDRATAELRETGFETMGVRTDVSIYEDVESLAQQSVNRFGKVHLLVNNAGVSITGPTWKMSLDDWRWVYGVNLWGVIHGAKAFLPRMIEQGEPAHVVNTASLAAFTGTGEHAPYCSSKAACLSISQSLYSELIAANTQIGVSVVCPGMVDTDIHKSWRNRPEGDQAWSDREWTDAQYRAGSDAFQGRGVEPSHIAQATLEAVMSNQFYVFFGEGYRGYLAHHLNPILKQKNPPVLTWGADLRPKASTPQSEPPQRDPGDLLRT